MRHLFRVTVKYALYPSLLLGVILVASETLVPLKLEWSMTWKSFWRDARYIVFVGPTIALAKTGFGFLAIRYSQHHSGYFSGLSVPIAAAGFLLIFEFFQYWVHRYSHSAQGLVGRFLWKAHLASHFNADIRAGWFNYLFIGTHRYQSGVVPMRLGVVATDLPRSEQVLRVLALPFR